ncbi:MAG: EpsG family protein [Anaerocolumna sp.]
MNFYIFVLILLLLTALFNTNKMMDQKDHSITNKSNVICLCLGGVCIFLLMALKQPLTGDYGRYGTHFRNIMFKSLDGKTILLSEPGFFLLNRLIRSITDKTFYFFAITSSFICYSVGRYIYNNADNKKYGLYFYYCIGLFAFSMAGLRQTLAMSICLFSYSAIKDRKLLRFLIIIAFAFLFHKSAIFFMPAYFIATIKWKFTSILGAITLYSILILLFDSIYTFISRWLDYDYGIESTGNGVIFLFILLAISTLTIICRKKLLEIDGNNIIFINLHFAVLALWIFRLFTRTVERPSFFYLYASIILLDKILSIPPVRDKDKTTRKFLVVAALLFFAILFIYRLFRDGNLLPYIII